jgi:hypothetical protein
MEFLKYGLNPRRIAFGGTNFRADEKRAHVALSLDLDESAVLQLEETMFRE